MAKLLKDSWRLLNADGEAIGIVIEKSFQDGRGPLRKTEPSLSLARLERFLKMECQIFMRQTYNATETLTIDGARASNIY